MWLFDFIFWQKIDVIKWENPENYLLIKKYKRPLDEIKDDARLIVDPWQAAIFVHNWIIEAIQTQPGSWTLETENIPFITSLKNILKWFESPDKAAIYFVKTIEILNQKWWTKNPVKYIDPMYGFPVKLRAFGNFSFKITDIPKFWKEYVGTREEVTIDEIKNIIVDRILQYITDIFAEANLSYNEIDKNRIELADKIKSKVNEALGNLWITITDFRIEDINFTEDTEELIRKVAEQTANAKAIDQMKWISQEALSNYAQAKRLDAMEKAAENEWTAWAMMGMIVWSDLWKDTNSNQNIPQNNDIQTKLLKLKNLLDQWLISKEDYEKKKKEILDSI